MKFHFKYAAYLTVLLWIFGASANPQSDLFKAVGLDNGRWVQQLLADGADPNTPDANGQTPLTLALREDARQAAAALIASPKLVVDAANASGETALMMASLRGHRVAAQQLVARGAALNRAGWTPLHYAASGPDPQLVAWLLEHGAAIDAPSPNRTTALMMAARYGSPDTAELLLARGADPKLRNERELSAADFARAAGREALAARLEAASLR
jgi:ankyrin repeat protein